MSGEQGRMAWQGCSGYNRQSLVDSAMFRYKTIIGRSIQARTLPNQRTEAKIGCNVLNRMPGLGTPPPTDPCTDALCLDIAGVRDGRLP
jgi:hypothetical protein